MYNRSVVVSYSGTGTITGIGGGGGAGFDAGLIGLTGQTGDLIESLPEAGELYKGGRHGVPNLAFGNTRIRSGDGGNLGEYGLGARESFRRKTRFAQSGHGGEPGAAIRGYSSNRVTFVYTGNVLGDPTYKYQ